MIVQGRGDDLREKPIPQLEGKCKGIISKSKIKRKNCE